jgi:biopolymer transport protein TolR
MPEETRRPGAARVLADINITPLIDVMLVLLIIFMVVTPVAQRSLDIGLPQTDTGPPAAARHRPVVMTLEAGTDGRLLVSVDQKPLGGRDLASTLRDLFQVLPDKTLFVRVVGSPRYGQVVDAMDAARGAGVERIGIMPTQALPQ